MLLKPDSDKKDGHKYRFRVKDWWESLRWLHAFFLLLECHKTFIEDPSKVFVRRQNMLQVQSAMGRGSKAKQKSNGVMPSSIESS